MLSFRALSEKKTKIKINPKQSEITEKKGCPKCEDTCGKDCKCSCHDKEMDEAKYYDPMEDPDFDHDEAEATRGQSGKNKSITIKKKTKKTTKTEDVAYVSQEEVSEESDQSIAETETLLTFGDFIQERSVRMDRMKDRYLGNPKETAKRRAANVKNIRKGREEIASNIARLSNSPGGVPASVARQAEKVGVRKDHFKGAARAALKNSFEPEGDQLDEMPYQVYGSPDGKKEKKIGKPVKSKKYADARASELADTHKKTGGKYRYEYTEEFVDEGKKGLWDNIHARREAGKPKRKPGDKNYPKTLNVDEGVMPAAIDPAKHRAAQKATKIRNLMKGATTAGEKEAARRKTRGPSLAGEHYDWRQELGEGAAWTRKAGKSESGGLNEKGRKSYERENPGSDLKAPSKEPGNKRRSSFCARMKGMKKKLTSSKTARDPDSRINKSLRAWNC